MVSDSVINVNNLVMPRESFNKTMLIKNLELWEKWYEHLVKEINFIQKELKFAIELELDFSKREFKSRLSMAKTELELAEEVIKTYKNLLSN